jgi:hypothetical protein
MQRDMELIRDLLLGIEQDKRLDGTCFILPDATDNLGVIGVTKNYSDREIAYHIELLIEAGLVEGSKRPKFGMPNIVMPNIVKLTWQGHEFLDSVRDPGIWVKTKERIGGLKGVAFSVIGELAKAELKKHLGLP